MAQRLAPPPSRMTTSTLHLSPPRVRTSPPCAAAVGYHHTPRSPRVSAARAWFPWCSLVTSKCLLAVPIELLEDTSRQNEHQGRKESLWSKKALLAVLWEMAPGHPNLLPASNAVGPPCRAGELPPTGASRTTRPHMAAPVPAVLYTEWL